MSKTHWTGRGVRSGAGRGLGLAAAVALLAGSGASALAQNALGDGTALDANQRFGTGGKNSVVRDFRSEQQLRNAIVTGNAAGGMSFRGDVGYSAANDFRAALGSNDIFSFSRDSAYSGLATSNLRGLGGLRYQLDQSVAGQRRGLGGELIVARSGTSSSSWEVEQGARPSSSIDPFGHLRGSLRSTTDYYLENVRQPRILTTSQDNTQFLTASSLQGVKALSPSNSVFAREELLNPQTDETIFSAPSFGEDAAQTSLKKRRATGVEEKKDEPKPGETAPLSELVSPASPLESVVESLKANASSTLSKTILEREAEAAKARAEAPEGKDAEAGAEKEPASNDPFRSMLEDLRRELTGRKDEAPADPNAWKKGGLKPDDEKDKPETEPKDGEKKSGGLSGPGDEKEQKDEEKDGAEEKKEDIVERAQKLLGDSQPRLETLLQKEGAKDLYSLHMARGQEALNGDRWFDAEERFSAALRAQPGDPMAAAGRVSAQIGAGMYLSAATNLRNTLRAYPELIPAKFDVALFPQGERLQAIRDQLSQRSELNTPVARDAGLLLAFIGHQTGNIDDVRNGFAVMGRVDQAAGNAPDDLERIIRAVWLK